MFGTPGSVRVLVRFEGAALAALLMITTPARAASAVTMAPRPAVAQNTGTISGTVIDNTSQVVPGATVTLTNQSTRATHTATFVAPKQGFTNPNAKPWLGEVHVLDIGAPKKLVDEYRISKE